MNDLVRLRRRHAMFLKAIREMEESEAEHKRSAGDAYAEPQTLRWARLDLASTEEELTRLQSEKHPD
jgi:hypothetical protein